MSEFIEVGGFRFKVGGQYCVNYVAWCVLGIGSNERVKMINASGFIDKFSAEIISQCYWPNADKIEKVKRVLTEDDVGKWFKIKTKGVILAGNCKMHGDVPFMFVGFHEYEGNECEILGEMVEKV